MAQKSKPLPLTPREQEQIQAIYDRYKDAIARQIVCTVRNEHNRKDILQTVFLEVCRQWDTVQTLPEPALRCWLMTTAKYTSLNFIKKDTRNQSQLILDAPQTFVEPSFVVDFETEIFDKDHPVETEELLDWVAMHLKQTDLPLFAMLRQRLPEREIIRRNGKSVGATRTQITRLKAKVKKWISLYLQERQTK